MGRPKKALKVKEPIRLRERKLANGNLGLYLDIYVKGTRKYESLGLYLIPEKTPLDKQVNIHPRQVAEKIKADRIIALQERGIKQYEKIKQSNMSLLDWLRKYEQENFGFRPSTLKGRVDMRKKVEEYLEQQKTPYISMSEVDADFCRGFLRFLATAKNSVCTINERTISPGCAHHHQAVFNGALNKAVREGLLTANPMKSLDRKEKFQPSPEDREFLTIEELRSLMALPCSNEQVKKAFVFSCFTGLRLSHARTLAWRKVYKTPGGKTLYIHVFMQKTQKPNNIPLSQEALNCLQTKDDLDEPIFTLPASDATINYHVKKLVKAAGIEKKVSFHCSRHTFATMMLTLGVDIYTTSKLLGHANVTTTAIYAKIVDKKKVDAMNLVNDLFTKDDNTENYEDRTTQPQA